MHAILYVRRRKANSDESGHLAVCLLYVHRVPPTWTCPLSMYHSTFPVQKRFLQGHHPLNPLTAASRREIHVKANDNRSACVRLLILPSFPYVFEETLTRRLLIPRSGICEHT